MSSLGKDLTVLGIKAGLATAPFCGGIAEIFGWIVEGRFVDRRLAIIEKMLGDNSSACLAQILQQRLLLIML